MLTYFTSNLDSVLTLKDPFISESEKMWKNWVKFLCSHFFVERSAKMKI